MHYVYILESVEESGRCYVGMTSDLKSRLADHNAGRSPRTSRFRPWRLKRYGEFDDESRAESFELYLKSASGRAFQNKHIA